MLTPTVALWCSLPLYMHLVFNVQSSMVYVIQIEKLKCDLERTGYVSTAAYTFILCM